MFKPKEPSGPAIGEGRLEEETDLQTAPQRGAPPAQHSIIPAGLTITGDLTSAGDIDVSGAVHGNITCRTLTLSGQPVIQGSVKAETIRVCGIFDGEVKAKKVTLTRSAKMTGSIFYETLEMEDGAFFEGKMARL